MEAFHTAADYLLAKTNEPSAFIVFIALYRGSVRTVCPCRKNISNHFPVHMSVMVVCAFTSLPQLHWGSGGVAFPSEC